MKQIFEKLSAFCKRFKGEKWFRSLAVITVLIVLSAGVSIFNDLTSEKEKPPDTEETSLLDDIFEDSAAHVLMICGLSIALAFVEHDKELKLREKN